MNNTVFLNFCPEAAYDVFGLFASELVIYPDEIDAHAARAQLASEAASANDWRWEWSHITPLDYSECRLYSLLVSTNAGGTDKIGAKKIIEVKPGALGITVNIKEIAKRIWKCICSRHKG
ncbi:MAG TPA: hypothetical protein VJJ98_05990 [Sedimentisphaerales bacterium]|nr:hypothetical protein [Sedimentisphaerales bacterium]